MTLTPATPTYVCIFIFFLSTIDLYCSIFYLSALGSRKTPDQTSVQFARTSNTETRYCVTAVMSGFTSGSKITVLASPIGGILIRVLRAFTGILIKVGSLSRGRRKELNHAQGLKPPQHRNTIMFQSPFYFIFFPYTYPLGFPLTEQASPACQFSLHLLCACDIEVRSSDVSCLY